jgi:hypothetical protein
VTVRAPKRRRDQSETRCHELVLRNHDGDRAHRVTVEVTAATTAGRTVASYRLAPGEVRCPDAVAPRGPARVVARLGDATDAVDGVLGRRLGQTAVVEVGNGVVSATRGL